MSSRVVTPVLILAVGIAAWFWLSQPVTPPKPEHLTPQRLKTERAILSPTDYRVILDSQGTVRAHHMTTVTAMISGRVTRIHPGFEDGAFFKEGEILAEIDPADLQTELAAAESRLARAEATLAQEEARGTQARLNWQDMGYEDQPSPLVLRVPQLKEAQAQVAAARAEVDQSRRNLQRTHIRAPFDGRVKVRHIGVGQTINATTPLGDVFASDFAEVRLPLTPDQLPFVTLPNHPNDPPVEVTLTNALGSDAHNEQWKAQIVRTEGTLDEASRELFVIARIIDPFGLIDPKPELRIGQPVRAQIQGILLKDVFVIPRIAMRDINRIYLIDQEKPAIIGADIKPIWSNQDEIVVRDGVKSGDWLATSRLPYAPNGAPIDIIATDHTVDRSECTKTTPPNKS